MHILFTTYEFVTENRPCGGFGNYLANISSILAEQGNEVTILLAGDSEDIFEWKKNIRVVKFNSMFYTSHWFNSEIWMEALWQIPNFAKDVNIQWKYRKNILKINKIHNIDIVQYCSDYYGGWYAPKKIKSVIRFSSILPWYRFAAKLSNDMSNREWEKDREISLYVKCLRRVYAFYGPSRITVDFFEKKLRKKGHVIESPFINRFIENQNIEFKKDSYFLFVGRVCTMKGIYTIAEALEQILNRYPDMEFVFAGWLAEKDFPGNVEDKIGNKMARVHFLGEIKDKNYLYSLISSAKLCILPSRADNLPNSCIEAMGLGKTVVGTYGSSIDQLIIDGENGFLIDPDNSDMLLEKIEKFFSLSDDERKQIEENAMKRIEKMNPDAVYEKVIQFFSEVVLL